MEVRKNLKKMIDTFNFADHVVGFIVTDPLNKRTTLKVHEQIDEALKNFEKIDLYIENLSKGHIDLGAIFVDFKFKMERTDRFSKIAIVTNDKVFRAYCRLKALLMRSEVRIFSLNQRTEGLLWLTSVK